MSNVQQAPAFWLTSENVSRLYGAIQRDPYDDTVIKAVLDSGTEVPKCPPEVQTTLLGELCNFLDQFGIEFPKSHLTRWGILILFERDGLPETADQVESSIEDAVELSSTEEAFDWLILYHDMPELIRQGMEFLALAFRPPPEISGVLLILR